MIRLARTVLAALGLLAVVLAPTASAKSKTTWLCKPGLADNACRVGLKTTQLSASGEPGRVTAPKRSHRRRIDCFYVYPTVSDQDRPNANRDVDPELRSIALFQAARYNQRCRVWAPVYRQVTKSELFSGGFTEETLAIAYRDVKRAWRDYRAERGSRRGVILIGHSQGTFMLEKLLAEEIETNRKARKRLVAAILLGGNVTVEEGGDRGGSFDRVRACDSAEQLRCVIAWATYNDAVPENSIFGRTTNPGEEVLCTSPAALSGDGEKLRYIYPTEPFAPGTSIGLATTIVGTPTPPVDTPWYEARAAYTGGCSSADGADVLRIDEVPGAAELNASPDATWGLHLVDANIALGNLTKVVRAKARRYEEWRRSGR